MRVDRDKAAVGNRAACGEWAALALLAEAKVFKHHDDRASEAVVDTGRVHVAWAVTRHRVGLSARLHRAGRGQRRHEEDVLVGVALARAEDVDRFRYTQRFSAVRGG